MSTYVVGDIHGCFRTFEALLEKIDFSLTGDRLWLVGDLVNGGPDSLEVLRWVQSHDSVVTCVLGNHDLYFLGRAFGACPGRKRDTLGEILSAPDLGDLADWLRHRPLVYREQGNILVHAGFVPAWDLPTISALSEEIEHVLRGEDARVLLSRLFEKKRDRWKEDVSRFSRLCRALQIMTTIRTCRLDGRLCLRFVGPPSEAPPECYPWFSFPRRHLLHSRIYFGHWAALGFYQSDNAVGLDSGCRWGGRLTAIRLEDDAVFQSDRLTS